MQLAGRCRSGRLKVDSPALSNVVLYLTAYAGVYTDY